jgi:FlaA1/EpsC-like NDP-sugar epimerase
VKNRYVLLADLPLIVVSALGAFAARFDWTFYRDRPEITMFVVAALLIKPAIFMALGMYGRYWRYASVQELIVVVIGVTAASLGMGVFVLSTIALDIMPVGFSRVVFFTDWLLTLATTGGLRLAVRVVYDVDFRARPRSGARSSPHRILVVGAGDAGTMVAREMRRNPQLQMEPIGFLDDDRGKIGKNIAGLRVLGSTADLPRLVRAHHIDSVVIAMPRVRGRVLRGIVELCQDAGVKSQTVPGMFELLDGAVSVSRLRSIELSDLLRRTPVDADTRTADFVTGRVVLITGAGGSIGSELARQIANASPSLLVLLGHGENSLFEVVGRLRHDFPSVRISTVIADIRDDGRLRMVFDRIRPAIVFHAAAHKHVPLMEENPEEAVTNNIVGTWNVAQQALRTGVERFVLISTDKAVSPTSIMGATKRVAETIVRDIARRTGRAFVAVRFGNVLGSRGSVVHTFKTQIERGGPVTVTHPDMTRFFMTIPEAVHLVLQASGKGQGGELFVLDMGEPVRIVQLAQDLISLSGLTEDDVPIVFTGMRPGEKLEERLFDSEMQTRPTSHPEILQVVGPDACVAADVERSVREIEDAARRGDRAAIDDLLGRMVPGFIPAEAMPLEPPASPQAARIRPA